MSRQEWTHADWIRGHARVRPGPTTGDAGGTEQGSTSKAVVRSEETDRTREVCTQVTKTRNEEVREQQNGGVVNGVRTDTDERRRRSNQRPIYEHVAAWPAATPTGQEGHDEFPFVQPSAAMQDAACGCMHNVLHEHSGEAELRPMPLHNVPPSRPRRAEKEPQQPFTSKEYPEGWHPESPQDMFQTFTFTAEKHGKWITRFERRQRLKKEAETSSRVTDQTEIRLTPGEIVTMLETWVETNATDIETAEKAKTDGSRPHKFRARAATVVVPEEAFAEQARRKVYDFTAWYAAAKGERHGGLIKLVDVDEPRKQHWNVGKLREWAELSGCPDEMGVQQVSGRGIAPAFTGEWSIVLVPNAASYLDDIQEGQAVEREEIAEGLVSRPVMGLPMMPIKVHPRSIALQWRGKKLKKRVVRGNPPPP